MTSEFLNQAVPMCGFPQLIVTRAFAYQWLTPRHGKRFADMYAFQRAAIDEPLTDATTRDEWLAEAEN